jgi:hypothetical protein
MWSEEKGLGVVFKGQEWWVLLIWHHVDVKLWIIVSFLILQFWEFVLELLSNTEGPRGLNLSLEIWISVLENLDVEIELSNLIERGATSEDCSTDALSLLRVGLNVESSLSISAVSS